MLLFIIAQKAHWEKQLSHARTAAKHMKPLILVEINSVRKNADNTITIAPPLLLKSVNVAEHSFKLHTRKLKNIALKNADVLRKNPDMKRKELVPFVAKNSRHIDMQKQDIVLAIAL